MWVLNRASRLISAVLFAVPVTLGVAVAAAPGASAATCSGYTCHGHDPVKYGCSVASTKQDTIQDFSGNTVATIWNRYSANCNANWVRGQLTTAAARAGDSMDIYIETTDSRGNDEYMCYPSPSNDSGNLTEDCGDIYFGYTGTDVAWSDMVDGSNTTDATIAIYDRNGNFVSNKTVSQ
jgi:hypothetical protein